MAHAAAVLSPASPLARLLKSGSPVGTTSIGGLTGLHGVLPLAAGAPGSGSGRLGGAAAGRALIPATSPHPTQPNVIQRIERVVPGWLWLGLAAALFAAAAATGTALLTARRARQRATDVAALSAAALTDPLTGALNRRGFSEAVERELVRAQRYGRQFVLAFVDVRGLKAVNDTEGHQAGDELLKETTQLLKSSARANDVVGRLGGDELALLLVEIEAAEAARVIHRIHSNVAARRAALGLRSPWGLTIGTASYPRDGSSFDELLRAADLRLYEQRGIALH
ncbi:MAG: GGDEF domain-containing protein [Solirubrobacterales bacterium]|nr:GGDEF domain-containing protein [Solirubrobacterales bacterium]